MAQQNYFYVLLELNFSILQTAFIVCCFATHAFPSFFCFSVWFMSRIFADNCAWEMQSQQSSTLFFLFVSGNQWCVTFLTREVPFSFSTRYRRHPMHPDRGNWNCRIRSTPVACDLHVRCAFYYFGILLVSLLYISPPRLIVAYRTRQDESLLIWLT